MKTGRLLDILSGHEGPVHGLVFSPTNVSYLLTMFELFFLEVVSFYYFPNPSL